MQSVKSIPIVKTVQWSSLVGAALILLSGSGFALISPGPVENDCSIAVTSLAPLTEVVDITQPVVTHPFFNYGIIDPGDKITIDAGGCVQTGGKGLTWKRYV